MVLICRSGVFLLALTFACEAQTLTGLLGGSKSSTPAAPSDALGRNTPRNAIFHFLEACHDERYVVAARYLDLRKMSSEDRRTQGPDLAKQLADLLDRDPKFEVDSLSDTPEGDTADGLASGMDNLLTLTAEKTRETLYLQRVTQSALQVWLVSADSVARIPELAAMEGECRRETLAGGVGSNEVSGHVALGLVRAGIRGCVALAAVQSAFTNGHCAVEAAGEEILGDVVRFPA